MKLLLRAFGGSLVLWLLACAPQAQPQDLPAHDLDFSCRPAQNSQCSSAWGRLVFLGLKKNAVASCSFLLKTAGTSELYAHFDYTSQTHAQSDPSGGVWGRFQSFFNRSQEPSPFLEAGFYQACNFIDVNMNGFLDAGEPLLDEAWNPSTDLRRHFQNWGSAP